MDTGNQDRIVLTAGIARLADRCKAELPDGVGHLIFWPLLLSGLLADLWTKHAVFAWLEDKVGHGVEILDGILTFRMALNSGAACGILPGRSALLAGISVIALLAILGFFLFAAARQRIIQVSLGLFAAGVSGNLWDRLFNGGLVRDFIDVGYRDWRWHTFNVADSMLCVAVVLLVVAMLFTGSSDRRRAPRQK
ncbi:MAG: signal peptidase II [Phycisphaerae bacterium]|nr:signal peptidase II [Phycisphaerae bacterium]